MSRLLLASCACLVLHHGVAVAQSESEEPDEPDRRKCSREALENCLNGVGGGVTSLDSLRVNSGVSSRRKATEDDERAGAIASAGASRSGVAAGSGALTGWSVWGSWSFSDYESDVSIAPYDATTHNLLFGVDRTFADRFLAGITLGYENTQTDTFYNGGGQDRDGFTAALYGAYMINDIFSVDASAGVTVLDNSENRLATNNGATLNGEYDSDRYFMGINLNAVRQVERWILGGRLGLLHARETQDAYTETGGSTQVRSVRERRVDLSQLQLGADVGYSFGEWEPYALAIYRNDLSSDDGNDAGGLPGGVRTQPNDDDDIQFGVGLRYFGNNGISGSFEWLRTEAREDFDDDTFTLSVRVPL